eukprot:TRINITY_DN2784_c0_g1_i2.p1 TRINITY_DN2784_c0_g1~~TRINITY_DN2784_c0_g1_i2.p1  ORF type:complete len:1080 (+),score=371.20 TRINITY_DN2784_c0_g1_i2:241-3480(+)
MTESVLLRVESISLPKEGTFFITCIAPEGSKRRRSDVFDISSAKKHVNIEGVSFRIPRDCGVAFVDVFSTSKKAEGDKKVAKSVGKATLSVEGKITGPEGVLSVSAPLQQKKKEVGEIKVILEWTKEEEKETENGKKTPSPAPKTPEPEGKKTPTLSPGEGGGEGDGGGEGQEGGPTRKRTPTPGMSGRSSRASSSSSPMPKKKGRRKKKGPKEFDLAAASPDASAWLLMCVCQTPFPGEVIFDDQKSLFTDKKKEVLCLPVTDGLERINVSVGLRVLRMACVVDELLSGTRQSALPLEVENERGEITRILWSSQWMDDPWNLQRGKRTNPALWERIQTLSNARKSTEPFFDVSFITLPSSKSKEEGEEKAQRIFLPVVQFTSDQPGKQPPPLWIPIQVETPSPVDHDDDKLVTGDEGDSKGDGDVVGRARTPATTDVESFVQVELRRKIDMIRLNKRLFHGGLLSLDPSAEPQDDVGEGEDGPSSQQFLILDPFDGEKSANTWKDKWISIALYEVSETRLLWFGGFPLTSLAESQSPFVTWRDPSSEVEVRIEVGNWDDRGRSSSSVSQRSARSRSATPHDTAHHRPSRSPSPAQRESSLSPEPPRSRSVTPKSPRRGRTARSPSPANASANPEDRASPCLSVSPIPPEGERPSSTSSRKSRISSSLAEPSVDPDQSGDMQKMMEEIRSTMQELQKRDVANEELSSELESRAVYQGRLEVRLEEMSTEKSALEAELLQVKREFMILKESLDEISRTRVATDHASLMRLPKEKLIDQVTYLSAENKRAQKRVMDMELRLQKSQNDLLRKRQIEKKYRELEMAHMEQNTKLQQLQHNREKLKKYRLSVVKQEEVISHLEQLLSESVQEIKRLRNDEHDRKASMKRIGVQTDPVSFGPRFSTTPTSTSRVGETERDTRSMSAQTETVVVMTEEEFRKLVAHQSKAEAENGEDRDKKPSSTGSGPADSELKSAYNRLLFQFYVMRLLKRKTKERIDEFRDGMDKASRSVDDHKKEIQSIRDAAEESELQWEMRAQDAELKVQALEEEMESSRKRYGQMITELQLELAETRMSKRSTSSGAKA